MDQSSDCIVCGSRSAKLIFFKDDYPIVKCQSCGLVFVEPESFPKGASSELYDEKYFEGGIYSDYLGEREYRLSLFERKLPLVEAQVLKGGKLLDVGCAAGYFLEVAASKGYDVFGVEVSKYATDHVDESLRPRVFTGVLEDARFPIDFFDAITMWDVLEHLPNPLDALREAHRVLQKGGKLIVETVNVSCINAKLLGPRWPLYRPPFHLFYFSVSTLTELLRKSGFEVAKVEPMQTYSPFHRHKTIRYFDMMRRYHENSFIMKIVKRLFADVVLIMAET